MSEIHFEIRESLGIVTLNRPEKMNAFNRAMALRLQEVLDECQSTKAIRCVFLTGQGKAFSAGQDLGEVSDPDGPGMKRILSEHYNPIITRLRRLEKPVVAGVNGVAAGAGANIALACDVTLATESASFIQAFSKIGLIPDSGGTYFLPRLIGWQKASAIMMLGEKITAIDAEKMGMIYKTFPDDAFHQESLQIAITLSQMPTRGLAFTKQALNLSVNNTLYEQLQEEDVLQQKAAQTDDYKEGVQAFLNKRRASFKGK